MYQDNKARGNWDIWLWRSGQEAVALITSAGDQMYPATDGRTVVWQDNRNGNWDIYAYSLDAKKEGVICDDAGDQTEPRIRTGRIVWTDSRKGDKDIYIYENYQP